MSDTSGGTLAPTLCSALSAYVGLFRGLLPRASAVNIYDDRGDLLWATDLANSPQVADMVAQGAQAFAKTPQAPGRYQLVGSTPTYLFWIRREDSTSNATPLATVVIRLRSGGNLESCSLGFVHQLVEPAIQCLRRELLSREEIQRLRGALLEQPNVLAMLQGISATDREVAADGTEDLSAILASATSHLNSAMAALIVPDRSLALIYAAPDSTFDHKLFAQAHRQLLSLAKMRREPVIINRMPMPQSAQSTYRVAAAPIFRPDGQSIGVLALCRPESAAQFTAHHSQLMKMLARRVATAIAYDYDALTGLLTRPAFERQLRRRQASQKMPAEWTTLYIDVDRMHVINDTHGHHTGDRVISHLGELLRRRLVSGAVAARSGADRFSVLLPTALEESLRTAEDLRNAAAQVSSKLGLGQHAVSVCIGIAPGASDGKDPSHVLALAETACKAAKVQGPNRVELYREADESVVRRMTDLRLVANLRSAIDENRLLLAAQLIVPLCKPMGAAHFELLLRMTNEEGKRIGPRQFMPAALRHELLPEIDRWVVRRAAELLKAKTSSLNPDSTVFTINIAGQSLLDCVFAADVEATIAASGLNPALLCFELTEDAVVGNLSVAETFMRKMRKLGCGIALDDFGTGLSSLAYLRSLPIGILKIDGSFIRDVLVDPKAEAMVKTIAQLARSMSLVTVAKHIESDEVCARMTALGIDYGQGFAIAAPEALERVLCQLPAYGAQSASEANGSFASRSKSA